MAAGLQQQARVLDLDRAVVSWAQLDEHDYISIGRTSGNRVLLDQALAGVAGRPQAIYEAQHVTTTLGPVEAGL